MLMVRAKFIAAGHIIQIEKTTQQKTKQFLKIQYSERTMSTRNKKNLQKSINYLKEGLKRYIFMEFSIAPPPLDGIFLVKSSFLIKTKIPHRCFFKN